MVSSVLKSNAGSGSGSGSGSNTVSHTDHGPSVRPGPSLTGTDNRTGKRKRTGDGEGNHHDKTQGTSLPARSSRLAPVPRSAGSSRHCKAVAAGVGNGDADGDGNGNGNGDGLVVIAGGKGMEGEGEGEGEGENGSRNGIRRGTTLSPGRRRRRSFSNRGASRTGAGAGTRAGTEMEDEKETLLSLFFQPRRERVEGWMDSFWKRHAVLVIVPCLIVRPLFSAHHPLQKKREIWTNCVDRFGYGSPSRSRFQTRTKMIPFPRYLHGRNDPKTRTEMEETRRR